MRHVALVSILAGLAGVTLACSSSTAGGTAAPPDAGPPADAAADQEQPDGGAASNQTVLIQGTLAQSATDGGAQSAQDALFGMYRSAAQGLGNVGHAVFLDVAMSQDVLDVDTWDDAKGLQQFLSNPQVQKQDAQLFASMPTVTVAVARPGWYGWGSFSRTLPNGGGPAYVAVLRGKLAHDEATSASIHNQGAMQAQSAAMGAGDLAHIPYLDTADPTAFLVIDEWSNPMAPMQLYGSADFQKAFGALLVGAPTITLYAGTNWLQW